MAWHNPEDDDEFAQARPNPDDPGVTVRIPYSKISMLATEETISRIVYHEVQKALVNDENFRILVREAVREAMAKLNVAEVVEAAVQQVLGAKKG